MSIFRRRLCQSCGASSRDSKLLKKLPPCGKCGASTAYTPKWYISVRVQTAGGRRGITRAVSTDYNEAVAEERRLLSDRDQGAIVTIAKTDFPSAAVSFLRWVDIQESQGKISRDTARPYRYRLRGHLSSFFCGYDIRNIDHCAADAYVEKRQTDEVAPATINRELATLKKLLAVAVQKKVVPQHSLVGYTLLPEDNERDVYLTSTQADALLRECAEPRYPSHLYPIVLLALNTGLRKDGCLSLLWEEIDWKRGEIVKRVKGGKRVRVPITSALRAELERWRSRGGVLRVQGPVFPSPVTGKPMLVTSQFGFETACAAAGLEGFTFHGLRHSMATLFLEQHPDQIETLRDILGHSGSYMTRRYAHLTDKTKHEAMGNFQIGEG